MTKPLTASVVDIISARKGLGAGRQVLDRMRAQLAKYPGMLVKLDAADADVAGKEMEALNEIAGRLADEVQAFRENRRIERNATPPDRPCCKNCRWFEATLSAEAHVPAAYQAIVKDAGVCVLNPPVAGPRNGKGEIVTSSFPLVHPSRRCRFLELIEDPWVPGV